MSEFIDQVKQLLNLRAPAAPINPIAVCCNTSLTFTTFYRETLMCINALLLLASLSAQRLPRYKPLRVNYTNNTNSFIYVD